MTDAEIEEAKEIAYIQGERQVWVSILQQAMSNLNPDEKAIAQLVSERAQAINTLRDICAEHGDNDWDDNLHLRDILDKHLFRHLQS